LGLGMATGDGNDGSKFTQRRNRDTAGMENGEGKCGT
jgi:hypothetical protein